MADWEIQKFSRSHDRSGFDCGNAVLNDWLSKRVTQFEQRDLSRTYVAVRPGERQVCGYYALSNHRVSYQALPREQTRGLPRIDIPVILLGRLAVDRTVQGQRLGEFLLIDVLRRSAHLAEQIGIRAIEVDAIDAAAREFYLKYCFVPLRDDRQHLFLPMQTIRKLKLPRLES